MRYVFIDEVLHTPSAANAQTRKGTGCAFCSAFDALSSRVGVIGIPPRYKCC
jgi:hypothetical protein